MSTQQLHSTASPRTTRLAGASSQRDLVIASLLGCPDRSKRSDRPLTWPRP